MVQYMNLTPVGFPTAKTEEWEVPDTPPEPEWVKEDVKKKPENMLQRLSRKWFYGDC